MSVKQEPNLSAAPNRYMRSDRLQPVGALGDGTHLYPAYYPVRWGERYRRQMGFWSGQTGEWVGVTWDGRLFNQTRYWGNEGPRPDAWQKFRLG